MAQNFCENVFPIEWKQGTDNVRWNLCLIFVRKRLWTQSRGGHKAPFHPGHDGGGLDHAIKDRIHGVTCNCFLIVFFLPVIVPHVIVGGPSHCPNCPCYVM